MGACAHQGRCPGYPESDRPRLRSIALGLVGLALVLGVLTMAVGYTDVLVNPVPCPTC